ncbi:MAG: hypothetical protein ACYC6A_13210 [Armatimonadota bacterium]
MRFFKFLLLGSLGLLLFLVLAGCAGSGSGTIAEGYGDITSFDTELLNGAHADKLIGLRAYKDGWVCVDMKSDEVDSLVMAWEGSASDFDDDTWIGEDDESGDYGYDARLVFPVYDGMYFSLKFTTYGANDFGSYYYRVHYVDSDDFLSTRSKSEKKPLTREEMRDLVK